MYLGSYLRFCCSTLYFKLSTRLQVSFYPLSVSKRCCTFQSVSTQQTDVPFRPSVPATQSEYLTKLLIQQPHTPPDARVLKVAVIGCPNAGKSSLVNMLVKWRVCAVAGKAHTTRSKQMAALMQDNVQVVFVDLPGFIRGGKLHRFNLEKAFVRDPHAAVYDSDLILVVVDVTHARSREQLDPEVVKALHFFEGKESVLVLNKIDKMRNHPTRLLEVTRRLTRGIVHNKCSHVDAYEARFRRRQDWSPTSPQLKSPSELITAHLPRVCLEEAEKFLSYMSALNLQLSATPYNTDNSVQLFDKDPTDAAGYLTAVSQPIATNPTDSSCGTENDSDPPALLGDRVVTEADLSSIDDYFSNYNPDTPHHPAGALSEADVSDLPTSVAKLQDDMDMTDPEDRDPYFKSMLETLQEQLLLKTVSAEEVAARRKRWLEISIAVKGTTDWTGFDEVFMVSSATGDGIDRLRDYLVCRAVPGRNWLLSPLLITDHEPVELVRMCVWAHCLDKLKQEVPYSIRIAVDECEKVKLRETEGDERVFVHARLQCRSERHLRQVLGIGGSTIKEIAGAAKLELMTMFRTEVVVKLTAEMLKISPTVKRQLRRAKDFADVFPEQAISRA